MWSPQNDGGVPVPNGSGNGNHDDGQTQVDPAQQAHQMAEGMPSWDLEPPAVILRRPER
jgi:hypothetical protein